MTVAFYISGHGFGHASRDVEIVNALAARRPHVRLVLRTSVTPWLLRRTITIPFDLHPEPCDTGVVQIDSLRLDARATIARARAFYATLDAHAAREAALLREKQVRLVLADAPPVACAAAALAGIPAIVIGNFTWDWIYAAYADELRAAPDLVPTIQRAYALADEAWRLPLHGGFGMFEPPSRARVGGPGVMDVPFVARHSTHERHDTLERLGLRPSGPGGFRLEPEHRRLALTSFGGYGIRDLDLASLDCLGGWDVVVTGPERPAALPYGVYFFEEEEIYDRGLRYEDLVAAADVVVTKPGYGIVSECLANETAVVYTSRGHFAEYPVLVEGMQRLLRCEFLKQHALFAGQWLDALERARGLEAPPERPPTNGADVIADMICRIIAD